MNGDMIVMKKSVRIVWLMCVVWFFALPAHAQKVGSTSMQFLKVIPSARGAALGDAYSVLASGADAALWNPSGLVFEQNQSVSFSYLNWIFYTRQGGVTYALSLGDVGVVGVQLQYVDYGEIEEAIWVSPYNQKIEGVGLTGRTFRPYSYVIGASYASYLTDRFATGFTVKYAHESLYDGKKISAQIKQGTYEDVKTWANGLLFDFGMRYNTGYKSIEIATSVQNFGGNVTYAKESSPVPMMFRLGIAANVIGKESIFMMDEENRLTMEFDLFQPNDYAQQEHVGIEYEYAGFLYLRGGYKFNYDFDGLTLGGGIKQEMMSAKISFDYSFSSIGTYLGNVHRLTVGVGL